MGGYNMETSAHLDDSHSTRVRNKASLFLQNSSLLSIVAPVSFYNQIPERERKDIIGKH